MKTSFYVGGSICPINGIKISGTLTVPGPDGKPVQISQTALQNAQNAMFNGGKTIVYNAFPAKYQQFRLEVFIQKIINIVNPYGQLWRRCQ